MRIEVIQPSQIPDSWYGQIIGFDIETEDKYINSPICMVSIWKYNEPVIYVIPIKVFRSGIEERISEEELDILKRFLSQSRVAGHNLQFDLARIGYQWKTFPDIYMDTFLVARILQLEKQGLKDIALRIKPELSRLVIKFKDLEGLKPPFYYNIDDQATIQYSGLDAYLPFVVIKGLSNQIKANEKIIKLETEMLKTSIDQNIKGLNFDLGLFNQKVLEFSTKVEQENKELDDIVGWHVRCNATADKKKLLIDYYGCEPTQTTPKGVPSMSSEALEQMKDNDDREEVKDIISRILSINENFAKYNSVKKVPDFIIDNKLHFNVEQIGYDGTARIYCLTGDNKVVIDGNEITIEELYKTQNLGMIDSIYGPEKLKSCWISGEDDIYEVELQDGKTVRCNGKHPFAVKRDEEIVWVQAKDLTEQDEVVIKDY